MKTGDYEWCSTCDGDGRVTCPDCGGLGCINTKQIESDMAEAAKLQATLDERKDT
jgi:DnaJ-class molecular chaperone